MSKTILVTGGAGFIGSSLIDTLISQNRKVICLDNFDGFYSRKAKESNIRSAGRSPLFTLIEGDIRDRLLLDSIFKNNEIHQVVHLAAKTGVRPSLPDPQGYFDVNVNGTLHLMEAMKAHDVKKLVFASSSSVYGNNAKTPFSEGDNVDYPISPYAASKKSCELLTYTYHHLYRFSVINLRFFVVFGPRQRPDLAIHKFFKSLYAGHPIEIYGDGGTSRDYTYVDDIISGIIKAIDYLDDKDPMYEIINLGNNTPIALNDLITKIEEVTARKFIIKKMPMQQGDVDLTVADISKAKKMLGYQPQTILRNGLIEFKNWFESL
jgi:UDP-glucuronate 4-epimerase